MEVEFYNYHLGHEQEMKHVNLKRGTREWLASQLAMGLRKNEVLKQVRDNMETVTRENLITAKYLDNIERKFNTKKRRHENDAVCVDS